MVKYKNFTSTEFMSELVKIRKTHGLGNFKDCTSEVRKESKNELINEYIYMFDTDCDEVKVLIYSSIEKDTFEARENGKDAVRLVYRSETENGVFYKRIGKHLRGETLFKNLEETLCKACVNCDKLPGHDWKDPIEYNKG